MNNKAFCIETIGGAVELVTFSRSNAVASLTPTTTLLYSRLMWLSPSSSRGNNLKTRRQRRKHWKSVFTRSSREVTDARDARAKLTTALVDINFARASRFFVHFFAHHCSTRRAIYLFSCLIEDVNKGRRNFLFLSQVGYSSEEFNSKRVRLHFTK